MRKALIREIIDTLKMAETVLNSQKSLHRPPLLEESESRDKDVSEVEQGRELRKWSPKFYVQSSSGM